MVHKDWALVRHGESGVAAEHGLRHLDAPSRLEGRRWLSTSTDPRASVVYVNASQWEGVCQSRRVEACSKRGGISAMNDG